MKFTQIAQAVSLICFAGHAMAQSADAQKLDRVEVTGSSIKRIAAESALPVQVITREDIARAGVLNTEALMNTISANVSGAYNLAAQQGFVTSFARTSNGQANANLRGLGSGNTLVLLNGRRISVHGLGGRAVDLNSIPLEAVERVEVLKDGASAIYGTDAIGGVINFILRKDYEGAQISGYGDITEAGGGNITHASLLGGIGTLGKDKYNVMANVSYDYNQRLRAQDRDFAKNGYQPERGLSPDTTGVPFANIGTAGGTALPGSFRIPGNTTLFNRANLLFFTTGCATIPRQSLYAAALWGNPNNGLSCAYDYGASTILQQQVERTNVVSRGTMQIAANHTAFAEVVASRTKSREEFTESQFTTFNLPRSSPYYVDLSPYIPSFDNTKPERVRWRCMECGARQQTTTTDAYRFQIGFDGLVGMWDYKVGLSTAQSKADTNLTDGYVYNDAFTNAFATGLINPFLYPGQTQTPAALALIESTKAKGPLFGGKATVDQIDGTLSGDVWKLPAGQLSAAVGFDVRRESYFFKPQEPAVSGGPAIKDAGGDPLLDKATRDIRALFAEINVPIVKELEAQLAVRRDDYSKIGATTNPKVALAWRPTGTVLVRGSYNEGFHAPDYPQLYSGQIEGLLNNAAPDPILCPQHPGDPQYCNNKFNTLSGGNPNLKPEKSKQWMAGLVLAPTNWLTMGVDYFKIERTDRIVQLDPRDVLANYDVLGANILRGPDGQIVDIVGGWVNAAGDQVKGVDVNLNVSHPFDFGKLTFNLDGTWLQSFKARLLANQPYTEYAGEFGNGAFTDVYARWKHNARITWERGAWSTSLYNRYVSSYKDEKPLGVIPPGFDPYVAPYFTFDLMVTYKGLKDTTITAGIKNLWDKDPPFSAHNVDDVGGTGWDARVGDPRGRSFYIAAAYKFK